MSRSSPALAVVLSVAVLIGGCGKPAPSTGRDDRANRAADNTGRDISDLPSTPDSIRFAMPGEASAMPSLAASGGRVALVWTGTRNNTMNVYAAVSEDGGATFPVQTRVNDRDGDVSASAEQPPRVAVTPAGLAVIWPSKQTGTAAIRMARSTDGGRTFSHAVTLHSPSLKGARGWQSLAVGPDGLLHAVWLDGRNAEPVPLNGTPRQDVYAAVIDETNKVTETEVAANVCFCCTTAVAVGGGNHLFVAWRHIFPGSIRDIAMAESIDGGRQFGPLARVSEDKWKIAGCPEDGPALAVDAGETVHAVWPTAVSDGQPQKAVFYASTKDGRTFTPRLRLSASGQADAAHPQVAMGKSGGAAAVWDEAHDGIRLVMFRTVWPRGQLGIGRSLNASVTGAYPVIASIADGLLVAWTSGEGAASGIVMQRLVAEDPPGKAGEKKPLAFQGRVEHVDARARTLTVQGDNVPGWMSAMTMIYAVDNREILANVQPGDRITATVYSGDFQTLHGVAIVR